MTNKEKTLKTEIIKTGRKLYTLRLVAAKMGNLSARLDRDNILITATGVCLGGLEYKNILKVSLTEKIRRDIKPVSSEFPLHRLIYKNLDTKTVIHCHPPLTNAYFSIYPSLKVLTHEAKFCLGNIPVVKQGTPTISKPELVINALKRNNLVAIKNHGIVCSAKNFEDGLHLIELLEETVKTISIIRLFKKEMPDDLDKTLKENLTV
ncbi:MAG: class II aldolase/adducin family protein [Candidatus Omnitrophica bacterium]|nr:class II aldolase/adducin family protein [Candidatus Omnitrophota bacterium]MBU4346695.1 class II aldolase/adducin family protein [Candidatus Omnitrophota bacterium]MBU4472767.1 class II aldolase/adducin family protein [Candidatus Omnitrophota bacterium]MCG2706377.1 class II aldolase/adducin family protein [Candidatus Omnitrophota bacterium]